MRKLLTLCAAAAVALVLGGCLAGGFAGAGRDVEIPEALEEPGRLVDQTSAAATTAPVPASRGPLTRTCFTPARQCRMGPPAQVGMACECRAGDTWVRGQVY